MRERPSEQFLAGIGRRLRAAREDRRLSLDDLASLTDQSKTGLWQIEKGRTEPGAGTLARLSKALGVSIDWLVLGEERP